MHKRLQTEPIPNAFERGFRLWSELHRHRPAGGFGIGTFTWGDFHAYGMVTGDRLSASDLEAIRVIDDEFMRSRADAEARRDKSSK